MLRRPERPGCESISAAARFDDAVDCTLVVDPDNRIYISNNDKLLQATSHDNMRNFKEIFENYTDHISKTSYFSKCDVRAIFYFKCNSINLYSPTGDRRSTAERARWLHR